MQADKHLCWWSDIGAQRLLASPASRSLTDTLCNSLPPLITLAAAAAVTKHIQWMTTILILPLHSAWVLAKEAGSLGALLDDQGFIFDEMIETEAWPEG